MWIATLWANPLVRKVAVYAAVGLATFLCIRWYGNRQYAQGASNGRAAATVEVEKAMAVKMAEAQAEIDKLRTANEAAQNTLAAERGRFQVQRAAISKELEDALYRSGFNPEATCEIVQAIPASGLDAALRTQSAKLAARAAANRP